MARDPAKAAPSRSAKALRRGAARLAAVQALYQIELTEAGADRVLREFISYRFEPGSAQTPDETPGDADREMFVDIVRGATERRRPLDEMIGGALAEGWTLDRMDRVLRALLRAGAYELTARADVPARVVIAEYVDLANAFYDGGKEPGFVNGLLDRLAKALRPAEMPAAAAKP
jgi:transcription antitermination protein NusB